MKNSNSANQANEINLDNFFTEIAAEFDALIDDAEKKFGDYELLEINIYPLINKEVM